jgi:hypothetical protein
MSLKLNRLGNPILSWTLVFNLALVIFLSAVARAHEVAEVVRVANTDVGPKLAPRFLGLSYESSMLLPQSGRYYFDARDESLVHAFQTLGIKSLRVGANAVDDPAIPVPQPPDIDRLFDFARAAGVKVIYSFRLKGGDPADSARLASYIAAHDADALDCFSIGNEPDFYLRTFHTYYPAWKAHYNAILREVPNARFDGPSVAVQHRYVADLAELLFAGGHLAMVSDHYYFLGSGRAGEKDPAATRERFLSDAVHQTYENDYAQVGARLLPLGVPYRIDELNSCYNGGAKGSSDTYAATLWALDCTHWWAAHHLLGMNYHTGESVGRDGGFGAANYAAFVHAPGGNGFIMRPQAYAYLAFTQGAHGRSLPVEYPVVPGFDFDAYAYMDLDHSVYVTLINKSYGLGALPAAVSVQLFPVAGPGIWQKMDLLQQSADIAARTNITLGGAAIDPQGIWSGGWQPLAVTPGRAPDVQVAPASATLLRFFPDR